jgi:hypothetical protein
MTTSQAQPTAPSRSKRVAVAALAIVGYGFQPAPGLGVAGPVDRSRPHLAVQQPFRPRVGRLPPLTYWTDGSDKIAGLRRIGTIPGALGFGDAPAYSSPAESKQFTFYTFMLVRNGGCYQYYTAQQTG